MSSPRPRVGVFISAKSDDYEHAETVYRHLLAAGVRAFFSRESLPELGSADYRREIDRALDEADHLVVVTSSSESVLAPWVEAEWGFFINEKRSGRKRGNLVTVVVGDLLPADLPPSLRYYEVLTFERASLDRLLRYVQEPAAHPAGPDAPGPSGARASPEVATFGGPPAVHLVKASPGREALVATGGLDGAVRLYDTASRTRLAVLGSARYWAKHEEPITALEFSQEGSWLATGHLDGSVHVWELEARREVGHTLKHELAISGLAWLSDGSILVTASKDGVTRISDIRALQSGPHEPATHRNPAPVVSITCAPERGWLVTGLINMASRHYVIQIHDVSIGYRLLATIGVPDSFAVLALSGDGRVLAAGGRDGVVRLYDFDAVAQAIGDKRGPRSLPPLLDLRRHVKPVTSLAFFGDAQRLATCAADEALVIWALQTGRPSAILQGQDGETFVNAAVLGDGVRLVAALADGRLRVWGA